MMKTMVIEPVSAFNGMDVLVARDEGLFASEGPRTHSRDRGALGLRMDVELGPCDPGVFT